MRKDFYEYARYGSMGMSWVFATVVYGFLGYAGGNWLDEHFGVKPLFLVAGLMAAMAMSLRSLFQLVLAAERELRAESATRKNTRGGKNEEDDG